MEAIANATCRIESIGITAQKHHAMKQYSGSTFAADLGVQRVEPSKACTLLHPGFYDATPLVHAGLALV
jgi:hypothetical protein